MMHFNVKTLLLLSLLAVALASCEKMAVADDDETPAAPAAKGNVTLRVAGSADGGAWQTRADGSAYWTHLCFVLYQGGAKVASVAQTAADDGFGQASLQLSPGSYELLVLAHSSDGNPTLTTPEKLQFTNAMGFSDTFYSYGSLQVSSEPQTHNITLTRATAMVRFVIDDQLPSSVAKIRLYYTGGSGALNAKTGLGCVASKQSVMVDAAEVDGPPYTFDLYTIPREASASLTLTVTAYNAQDVIVKERQFKDVTVERNMITEFSGSFFTDMPSTNPVDEPDEPGQDTFVVTADTEWGGTINKTY